MRLYSLVVISALVAGLAYAASGQQAIPDDLHARELRLTLAKLRLAARLHRLIAALNSEPLML